MCLERKLSVLVLTLLHYSSADTSAQLTERKSHDTLIYRGYCTHSVLSLKLNGGESLGRYFATDEWLKSQNAGKCKSKVLAANCNLAAHPLYFGVWIESKCKLIILLAFK